jgi:nucleoside-diphosphate-sugar epimerase
MNGAFVILGCGYTGVRVAERLAARGARVVATTRHPERLAGLAGRVEVMRFEMGGAPLPIDAGTRVLHSLPVPAAASIHGAARLVYLSTTGVYGDRAEVDETTPVAPRNAREQLRVEEERAAAASCANCLILRPAAIYGPGRGVHVSLREGKHRYWGDGSNYISRIHVDDLAALAEAALLADLTGAYPVADDEPARAIDITRFCAGLLDLPVPPPEAGLPGEDTRRSNRRVDGRAIRRALGVELRFPSYRDGIPEAMRAGQ